MIRSLFLIVIKSKTNKLLNSHEWHVGTPVARATGGFTGGLTFESTGWIGPVEAYRSRREAESEIESRKKAFHGVVFEVVEFKR